jgi:hypothetical protein
MEVCIYDSKNDANYLAGKTVATIHDWSLPLPLPGDYINVGYDCWKVIDRIFNPENYSVELFCELQ